MLIRQAVKTFKLINKEKAYKRKECQIEEKGGGGAQTGSQKQGMSESKHQLSVC